MKTLTHVLSLMALVVGISAQASDPVGVYARVEKVVFEPNDKLPETVKVYGTFSLAKIGGSQFHPEYLPPQKGYMFFKLVPGSEALCRNQWLDFRRVLGTPKCIGFGARRNHDAGGVANFNGTVRDPKKPAGAPDLFPVAGGSYPVDADHELCKIIH